MENEDQAWLDYRQRFAGVYDQANYSSPLQAWVMRAGHRLAERPFGPEKHFGRVLEIGAGTGEHYAFVRHAVEQYILSDSDPEALAVARRKLPETSPDKLGFELQSAQQLSHPEQSFDRVIATHVLEHINQPHLALKEWRRVVKDGGTLTVLIPTDPGIAWRLGRRLGSAKECNCPRHSLRLRHGQGARKFMHQPDRPAETLLSLFTGSLVAVPDSLGQPEPVLCIPRGRQAELARCPVTSTL